MAAQKTRALLRSSDNAVVGIPAKAEWISVNDKVKDEEFSFKLYYKDDSAADAKEKPAGDVKFAVYKSVETDGTARDKYYKWTTVMEALH